MAKTSKGRQKIQMVKMDNESNLQVTFSKRRSGLFKKASELCTLCGADIAIVVFSPGDKAYSFGHPCVERVLDRFLNGDGGFKPSGPDRQISAGTLQFMEMQRNATLRELNHQLGHLLNQLEIEKKRTEDIKNMSAVTNMQCHWGGSTDNLGISKLVELKASLEELSKKVAMQAEKVLSESSTNPIQYFGGAGSAIAGTSGVVVDPNNNSIEGYNIDNNPMISNVSNSYPYGRFY